MNRLIGRMRKFLSGSKGFTLIELLVVVAILGALAAVVIPNVSRFVGQGNTEAAKTEKLNVQAALDAWIADNPSTTLVAQADCTGDLGTVVACGLDDLVAPTMFLYPNYLRVNTTSNYYSWNASGQICQGQGCTP